MESEAITGLIVLSSMITVLPVLLIVSFCDFASAHNFASLIPKFSPRLSLKLIHTENRRGAWFILSCEMQHRYIERT